MNRFKCPQCNGNQFSTNSNENTPCIYCGNPTVKKMAVLNNRHYIGFELSSEYFDIACQRLDDVENENFFDQEVKEAEQ